MAKTYNPSEFEREIYEEWEKNGCFRAEVDANKLTFTIVIPPVFLLERICGNRTHNLYLLNINLTKIKSYNKLI